MEDVSLLTRVTVNQAGEGLIAQVVSKDYQNRIKICVAIKNQAF